MASSARWRSDPRRASVDSPRASTARVAAEAGLLSSWASPAARVPSATSASRCRAPDSIRRTVLTSPLMKCTPNGNHASAQRFRSAAASRSTLAAVAALPVAK